MGRPPNCGCQCNYVVLSNDFNEIDSSGDRTVRFQACNFERKKDGMVHAVCVEIDDKHYQYHITGADHFEVKKRDPNGNEQWTYSYFVNPTGGAPRNDWEFKWVAVDSSYNVYTVQQVDTFSAISKLNRDGVEQRSAYFLEADGYHDFIQIAVDSNGNTVVTGAVERAGVEYTSLIYFDSAGTEQWVANSVDYLDYAPPLGTGTIIVATFGRPVFDAAGNVYAGLRTVGEKSGFGEITHSDYDTLFKFDSSGSLVWSKQLGDRVTDLCIDKHGFLYATYELYFPVGGDPPYSFASVRIAKMDSDGNSVWDVEMIATVGVTAFGGGESVLMRIACDGAEKPCLYIYHPKETGGAYTATAGGAPVGTTSERRSTEDGSLLEYADHGWNAGEIGNVVASPGRHPNFF